MTLLHEPHHDGSPLHVDSEASPLGTGAVWVWTL
jgi:hypothetical protein